jgi:hypothetical protein
MDDEAARTLAEAERKASAFVADLTGSGLVDEWSEAATALYKEQYAMKKNPYGQPWTPKPGDDKRKVSSWKFGKVSSKDANSFSLIVARSNANRSCVPFEPRGLGRWKEKFQEIFTRRAGSIAGDFK